MIDPSLLTPSAVLEAVTRLVSAYPCGIACHASTNALHQIIEEMPVTLDLACAELIAIAPPGSCKMEKIMALGMVAWHLTDEDGRVHLTLTGVPELCVDGAEAAITRLGSAHQEMVLAHPDRLLGPDALITHLRSMRIEVPALDINVCIQIGISEPVEAPCVAMAS